MLTPKLGGIWQADLGIAGKIRPVVIVSREDPDPPRVLFGYVPLTTQYRESPYEVEIGKLPTLPKRSYANVHGGWLRSRIDEGMAYELAQSMYRLVNRGSSFKDYLSKTETPDPGSSDCEVARDIAQDLWKKMWSGYENGGANNSGSYLRAYRDDKNFGLQPSDFARVKSDLGASFSCAESAKILNNAPISGSCCIKFSCDKGVSAMKGNFYSVHPRNEIHPSLK